MFHKIHLLHLEWRQLADAIKRYTNKLQHSFCVKICHHGKVEENSYK